MATIMEGFAPPSIGVDGAPDASLDPFAAVRLPTLERSPSGEGDADAAGSGGGTCKASSVMLDADYAFVEGMEAARDQAPWSVRLSEPVRGGGGDAPEGLDAGFLGGLVDSGACVPWLIGPATHLLGHIPRSPSRSTIGEGS